MGVADQGMVKVPGLGFGVVESVGFRRLKLLCLRSVRGFGWVWCNSFCFSRTFSMYGQQRWPGVF